MRAQAKGAAPGARSYSSASSSNSCCPQCATSRWPVRSILPEHPAYLGEIARAREREHQQDARLLRIQIVGGEHVLGVIFLARDHAAVARAVGAHVYRPIR